jgi:NADH:ubiquinone oxidoreductase subunit H
VVTVVGVVTALFVLVVLVAAFVVALRTPWARIAVRVGGSWIAASGLLMLGWSMRGN